MEWTENDRQKLLSFKTNSDCDDIKIKEQIKQKLLNNKAIIHVLNNKDLEENDAEPDEYFGVNILPYYNVIPTQSSVQNFICFTVNYDTVSRYNDTLKYLNITFIILCEQGNIINKETGIPTHDLLAALIQDQFNWTNYFGTQIELVSDTENVIDLKYSCRTLVFEQVTPNNLVKTRNNNPMLVNKLGMIFDNNDV